MTPPERRVRVALLVRGLVLAGVIALAGCATAPPESALPPPQAWPPERAADFSWHEVRVRMGYEDLASVQWHVDALLAERVFAPILRNHAGSIGLWRFHRRAGPDELGHQFRFLFRADADTATEIAAEVRDDAMLAELLDAGTVDAVLVPAPGDSQRPDIGDASDPDWPEAIKETWPYYIMGVSQQWLALIAAVGAELPAPPPDDLAALLAHYRAVNQNVDQLWRAYAQHAWLHHLNALYGYRPLVLREERLIRF